MIAPARMPGKLVVTLAGPVGIDQASPSVSAKVKNLFGWLRRKKWFGNPSAIQQPTPKFAQLEGTMSRTPSRTLQNLTKDQIEDVAQVMARTAPLPMPGPMKLMVTRAATARILQAIHEKKIPEDVNDRLAEALNGGLLSEKLANETVIALKPHIDIPFVDEAKEEECIRWLVRFLVIEEPTFVETGLGSSAEFLQTSGLSTLKQLQDNGLRKQLATEINEQVDLPILNEDQEQALFERIIDAFAEQVEKRVPPDLLKKTLETGEDAFEIETFLIELLERSVTIPSAAHGFISPEKKHEIAEKVVKAWMRMAKK